MLGSITPLGERGRGNVWWRTATAYVVASTLGGAALGGGAALVGLPIDLSAGARAAVVVAACLVGLAADRRLAGLRVPSIRRQVDRRWIGTYRDWVVGAGFGAQLGFGLATIVTASATWAMLVTAIVAGSPLGALAIGVTFGLARALPLLGLAGVATVERLSAANRRLARLEAPARAAATAGQALVAAAALLLLVGP